MPSEVVCTDSERQPSGVTTLEDVRQLEEKFRQEREEWERDDRETQQLLIKWDLDQPQSPAGYQ